MEMADIILVNKADGDLKSAAMRTCADYSGALRLLRKRPQDPQGYPKAMTVSALQENGLETAWEDMQTLIEWRRETGHWAGRRTQQAQYWFHEEVRQGVLALLEQGDARAALDRLETSVAKGEITPAAAADQVLAVLNIRAD